jgi:hypothetical protein
MVFGWMAWRHPKCNIDYSIHNSKEHKKFFQTHGHVSFDR